MPEPDDTTATPNPDDTTNPTDPAAVDGSATPASEPEEPDENAETFDRAYVEKLRKEAGDNRVAAKEAREALEPLQQRLFAVLVEKTGRLADPGDLPFSAELLDDEEAMTKAIDTLLAERPHYAARRVAGDVGQWHGTPKPGQVNLGGMLRANA